MTKPTWSKTIRQGHSELSAVWVLGLPMIVATFAAMLLLTWLEHV